MPRDWLLGFIALAACACGYSGVMLLAEMLGIPSDYDSNPWPWRKWLA